MNGWIIAAGLAIFGLAVFLAFRYSGGTIVKQIAGLLVTAALDTLKADRMTPDLEAKMADCHRQGREWDNWRKRCKPPR